MEIGPIIPDSILLIDQKADRLHGAAMEGKRAKVAREVELTVDQRRALAREMWALEGGIGNLRQAIAELMERKGQNCGE
jgi:hypothetical protein